MLDLVLDSKIVNSASAATGSSKVPLVVLAPGSWLLAWWLRWLCGRVEQVRVSCFSSPVSTYTLGFSSLALLAASVSDPDSQHSFVVVNIMVIEFELRLTAFKSQAVKH